MKLTAEQRRAVAMLAGAGPRGATEAIMAANFGVELLAGLVCQGWASVQVGPRWSLVGRSRVEVVRMRITDPGRQALAPH
jgi:hypothetical protein